ncbi:hypothetical protein SS50377_24060 [Spironucleus salmonicida]|uniref:Uncharacterized protein n=1 Tax=Spironucleus salmonicida TaxID=348837 RepID=A0A9P8RYS5_9EUKA|nr:hypothetical protein SS50377_24060 [Spironucleus salmonicida]
MAFVSLLDSSDSEVYIQELSRNVSYLEEQDCIRRMRRLRQLEALLQQVDAELAVYLPRFEEDWETCSIVFNDMVSDAAIQSETARRVRDCEEILAIQQMINVQPASRGKPVTFQLERSVQIPKQKPQSVLFSGFKISLQEVGLAHSTAKTQSARRQQQLTDRLYPAHTERTQPVARQVPTPPPVLRPRAPAGILSNPPSPYKDLKAIMDAGPVSPGRHAQTLQDIRVQAHRAGGRRQSVLRYQAQLAQTVGGAAPSHPPAEASPYSKRLEGRE